jgi:hypothetical protein
MNIPKELSESIQRDLSNICQIHTCKHAADANSAMSEGAVLLAVSPIHDDDDGDGFRCLIGLPNDVEVTPHLTCYFSS